MEESLLQYYGTDWLAVIATFGYIYLLGNKVRSAFLVGVFGSGCWVLFGLLNHSWPQVIANVIFVGMNVRGYVLWKK